MEGTMAVKATLWKETEVLVSGTATITPEMEDIIRKGFARAWEQKQKELFFDLLFPSLAPSYQEIMKAIRWELEHRMLYGQ